MALKNNYPGVSRWFSPDLSWIFLKIFKHRENPMKRCGLGGTLFLLSLQQCDSSDLNFAAQGFCRPPWIRLVSQSRLLQDMKRSQSQPNSKRTWNGIGHPAKACFVKESGNSRWHLRHSKTRWKRMSTRRATTTSNLFFFGTKRLAAHLRSAEIVQLNLETHQKYSEIRKSWSFEPVATGDFHAEKGHCWTWVTMSI